MNASDNLVFEAYLPLDIRATKMKKLKFFSSFTYLSNGKNQVANILARNYKKGVNYENCSNN